MRLDNVIGAIVISPRGVRPSAFIVLATALRFEKAWCCDPRDQPRA